MKPYYEHAGITIYHGDCLDILPTLANVRSVVITDPPYNAGVSYGSSYVDRRSPAEFVEWLGVRFEACNAEEFIYFPGHIHLMDAPDVASRARSRVRRVLGWHKREFAGDLWASGPAISWEPIVWMGRSESGAFNKLFGVQGRDFLVVNSVHGNPLKGPHPCPKPLPVMRWLVGIFAVEAATAIDPFCGTGTTLEACKSSGKPAIGIEIEERYCEIAAKRLSQEVLNFGSQDVAAPAAVER